MAWTAPRTYTASELVTATILNTDVRDNLKAASEWTSFTPTWAATGGTPTIGNGSLTGAYIRAGQLCHFYVNLTIGSSTSLGTTTAWTFTYPFAFDGQALPQSAFANDSGGGLYFGNAFASISTAFNVFFTAGAVGYNVPFTWATGDYLVVSGTMRVAAP